MFFIDETKFVSNSSPLNNYSALLTDILKFAYYYLQVLVDEETQILAVEPNVQPKDILLVLKIHFRREDFECRMFVPSRWVLHCDSPKGVSKQYERYFNFHPEHAMDSLIETSCDTSIWNKEIFDLQCQDNDQIKIIFEVQPGSNSFPPELDSDSKIKIGQNVAARDLYGDWYHAQIVAMWECADSSDLFKAYDNKFHNFFMREKLAKMLKRSAPGSRFLLVHFLGFDSAWNEWVDENSGRITTIREGIHNVEHFKWYPPKPKGKRFTSLNISCAQWTTSDLTKYIDGDYGPNLVQSS